MQLFNISLNLPIFLTLLRLFSSLLFLPIIMISLLPGGDPFKVFLVTFTYVVLSITDFFDGYFARKYNQVTKFGGALDPIADKFLLVSTLITLLALGRIYFFWVIIFIVRELYMMSLRILALEHGFDIPVSQLGKYKTALQTVYITHLIFIHPLAGFSIVAITELISLALSLGFSILSAFEYSIFFKHQYRETYDNT